MQSIVVYYGGIIVAAISARIAQKRCKKNVNNLSKDFFWILSIFVLLVLFGLRKSGIGVDDNNYNIIFKQTSQIGVIKEFLRTTMEPGYLFLNYIIALFTENFQVVIFITTLIPIVLYYKALEYEKDKINMFWAVFLMGTILFIYFCGITRMFIATSIIAYGLRFVIEKKPIKYMLVVLIATTFHYTALFMITLLYFATEKEGQKKSSIKLLLTIAIIIMPIAIIVVSQIIFPNMGDRYSTYTIKMNKTITIEIFDKVPFLILSLFFLRKMNKANKHIRLYMVIYSLSIIISIYSTFMEIDRVQWYSMFSLCIILPSIYEELKKIKKQELAVMYIPIMTIYPILYSYLILTSKTRECMLTYSNILF